MALRAEFLVTAASEFTAKIGLELALKKIEQGNRVGEATIPRHGVVVKWRIIEVVIPTDTAADALVPDVDLTQPFADPPVPPKEAEVPPQRVELPDISVMDIEEARGVIVVVSDLDDLAGLEALEMASKKYGGGRKGVLKTIAARRKELETAAAEKATGEKLTEE